MLRIFFIALLVIGFIEALKTIPIELGILPPEVVPSETASIATALPQPTTSFFSKQGILIFYPNNVGPVPYIYYTDSTNHLATKGLVFAGNRPHDLEAWAGSRIAVEGYIDHSSIVVSRISYVAGP